MRSRLLKKGWGVSKLDRVIRMSVKGDGAAFIAEAKWGSYRLNAIPLVG
jgi:hypothetical protein